MDSDSSHSIAVTVQAEAWRTAVTDPEQLCRRAVAVVLASERAPPAEIGILLADDARIAALNRDYRGQDRPTNVLAFPSGSLCWPAAAGPAPLGDVVVALETSRGEATAEGRLLGDHLAHLVVHGTLHLLGYDHGTDDEADRMEALEVKLLAGLDIADPYRGEAAP